MKILTLLSVMEEHPELMANLHPNVLQVVRHIFQKGCQLTRICAKGVEAFKKYK
jgi:hypothetical protein